MLTILHCLNLAVRIGLLYVLAGLGGSLGSTMHLMRTTSPTISVGASGALFGLLGAMLSELLINWTIYVNKVTFLFSFSGFQSLLTGKSKNPQLCP